MHRLFELLGDVVGVAAIALLAATLLAMGPAI